MNIIKNVFWNHQEKRLRMAWRLTFQLIFLLILLGISDLILYLAGAVISIGTASINDPKVLSGSSPLTLLVSFLVSGFFLSLSVWLAGRFLDRRAFSDFGFRFNFAWWKDFWFGISLGAFLITAIFLVELAAGWVRPTGFFVTSVPGLPFLPAIFVPLLIYIAVGFYEELFSRGYQLTNLAEGFSGKLIKPQTALLLACLVSSLFFGLNHAVNPNSTLFSTLNISMAGIFLATGFLLTGELAVPIGLHVSWNFFQGNVFGFPVSGAEIRTASVIQIQQLGPDWLTGGAFGPEGGLIGFISILLGILLIIFWVKKQSGKVLLHTAISSPPASQRKKRGSKKPANNPPSDLFQGIQHIIWDWNGTLLDDLDLCLNTINTMLAKRNLDAVSRTRYLDIFGFPVIDYYKEIGFDFSKEPFEEVSTEFIKAYEVGRPSCTLMEKSVDILELIHSNGTTQSILSASKKNYLDQAVVDYGLDKYFTLVDGLEDHHAAGKLSLARRHLAKIDTPPSSILLIGDTLHDAAIARELGLRCCLIPNGHHSKERLENTSGTIIDSLTDLKELYLSSIK